MNSYAFEILDNYGCDDDYKYCPFIWKPVCGSDGKTYQNYQCLGNKECTEKPDLTVAYRGECKKQVVILENGGKECYHECNLQQGKCNWCGPEGWCCRLNWVGNGCDGNIGELSNHQCVLKPTVTCDASEHCCLNRDQVCEGRCIPESWVNDGKLDCEDGSDEKAVDDYYSYDYDYGNELPVEVDDNVKGRRSGLLSGAKPPGQSKLMEAFRWKPLPSDYMYPVKSGFDYWSQWHERQNDNYWDNYEDYYFEILNIHVGNI